MDSLQHIYERHKVGDWPDKDSTHSYIEIYEKILKPYRAVATNILEIGLMSGESLRMWDEYFWGQVYGMDCSITPINGMADLTQALADGLNVCIGDATNPSDVEKFFKGMKFNVVIEDANHDLSQQLKIYHTLKPYLSNDYIYIIEDVQSIDTDRDTFENIDNSEYVEVIDRRHIKHRYDDVLVIIKGKQNG